MAIFRCALFDPTLGQELINLFFAFCQFKGTHSVLAGFWNGLQRVLQVYLKINLPVWREPSWLCEHVRKGVKDRSKTLFPYSLRPSRGEAGTEKLIPHKTQAQVSQWIALHLNARLLPLFPTCPAGVDRMKIQGASIHVKVRAGTMRDS